MVLINRELFAKLIEELNLSTPGLYHKIKRKKEELGFGFSENIAALIIAREQGIDVYPYLTTPEEKAEYREALKLKPTEVVTVTRNEVKGIPKVTFPDKLEISSPNLPRSVLLDAERMTEVYPYFYIFENSVRYFIINILEAKYGPEWWEKKISREVKRNVDSLINQEEKQKWHGKRGKHPIFYSAISDLKAIINVNWVDFQDKLPGQEWINQRIDEIELSRNTVAHNNSLEKEDFERVKLYFRDWVRQINPD